VGAFGGNRTGGLSDDDAQLGLIINLRRDGGEDDRLAGPDDGCRPLREEQRARRQVQALLLRVVAVVEADTDDLRRAARRTRRAAGGEVGHVAALTSRLGSGISPVETVS
jgi:hypothetical protein